ncbi:glycosyltransferase family 2 protein [Lysobacter sp. 2RAF19]
MAITFQGAESAPERPIAREVAIVIVDRAGLSGLQQCLHHVRAKTEHAPFDVVVASTRAPPLRNALFTGVRWASAAHAGIADACNRAVDASANEIVVLVDSRCQGFDARWLTELTSHAREDGVGLVAPQRNDDDGAAIAWGCIAVRRNVFLRDSGFDPSYRDLDCATADLALRIGLHGLKHRALPSVPVRLIEASTIARLLGRHRQRIERERLNAAWQTPVGLT